MRAELLKRGKWIQNFQSSQRYQLGVRFSESAPIFVVDTPDKIHRLRQLHCVLFVDFSKVSSLGSIFKPKTVRVFIHRSGVNERYVHM